ncbi:MAG TPA: hypothetical protein VMQ73_08730 [Methylomirabilota bacterium]|nr:hypothetical protein [Methylomirabilota bacterium]
MNGKALGLILLGFVAGAIGVLIFHQGVLLVMHAFGLVPFAPYAFDPTPPFGVPRVLSLAFWGGVWGIVLVWFMGRVRGADRLWVAIVFGGVLPSLVGMFVVTPLKGGAITLGAAMMLRAFVINGAWGLGTALTYRAARRVAS